VSKTRNSDKKIFKKQGDSVMTKKSILKRFAAIAAATMMTVTIGNPIHVMAAEGEFDPVYYGTVYPDVAAVFGTDAEALYNHYIIYGQKEGRIPYAGAAGGETVTGIAGTSVMAADATTVTESTVDGIVPIDKLQNYTSLKKKMTDVEFQMAYNEALKIVQPLVGLNKEEQAVGIVLTLRNMVDSGQVSYSTDYPHYNDAFGYLVNHVASCAGSTRTTGLCLNMLGINYEHVNENQWTHQWCRADLDGIVWVVDPYAYTCMPEEYPYWHPLAEF